MKTFIVKSSITAVLLFFPFLSESAVTAPDYEPCKSCHGETYNRAMSLPFRHKVVDEKCGVCHILSASAKQNTGGDIASYGLKEEMLFPLKGLSDNKIYSIEVTAKDVSLKRSRPLTIEIRPADVEEYLANPGTLSIGNVKIEEIKESVFPEVTLSWTTDGYSKSHVEYGPGKTYTSFSGGDIIYSKEHRAVLPILKRDNIYRYRIVAEDIFGNRITSEAHSLDVLKPLPPLKGAVVSFRPPVIGAAKAFKTPDGDAYLLINVNKPSTTALKIAEISGAETKKDHGNGFLTPRTSQIDVCTECHLQKSSHPVGVAAITPNTSVPRDLPTLPGGIITCNTCHFPHGGDKKYFARLDFQRDVCIQCHKGEPYIFNGPR